MFGRLFLLFYIKFFIALHNFEGATFEKENFRQPVQMDGVFDSSRI